MRESERECSQGQRSGTREIKYVELGRPPQNSDYEPGDNPAYGTPNPHLWERKSIEVCKSDRVSEAKGGHVAKHIAQHQPDHELPISSICYPRDNQQENASDEKQDPHHLL